jgi:RNA exonuclease 1
VAESKSSRKKRRKLREDPDGYPSINFLDTKPARVQMKALQDLVLYLMADGVAPTWLAINSAKQIDKVVVLMIPGLDRATLEDPEILKSATSFYEQTADEKVADADTEPRDQTTASATIVSASTPVSDSPAAGAPLTAETIIQRHRLLSHIIEVRAPGDSHANRVHSPLQGMLIAPLSSSDTSKNNKKTTEKSFQPTRTSITHFVHSADELREAEYPIHPAAFTNAHDAHLEETRRVATFQSSDHGWVDTAVTVSVPVAQTITTTSLTPTSPPPTSSTSHSRGSSHSKSGQHDPLTQGLRPFALDCEMVLTNDDKYSLARISLVDWSGSTVLDSYVKPSLPIKNYFTQYSGITPSLLENITTSLSDIQSRLLSILGSDSILLGHSLESDLNALKLTHPFIVDTSIIYPHPRGLPLRSSLKFLANRYLKREIQKGGADGHDSVEDARAVLDLVKLKCEKGPRWGTLDANGESIFKSISRGVRNDGSGKPRESAIVEYGTPERGFGKEATYKIACTTDDEIVQGVIRAASGDPSPAATTTEDGDNEKETKSTDDQVRHDRIPAGGVDFIWGRLRNLEALRGWNTPPAPPDSEADPKAEPSTATNGTTTDPKESPEQLHQTASRTLAHLLRLYAGLPPRTLLITYSGTSDMRPLLRLQQLQTQFRKEFKVKKWDELSVKWTDTEEQLLRAAVDSARKGVGILTVK